MNKICEVVRIQEDGEKTNKNFEIILPSGAGTITAAEEIPFREGQVIVIPPRIRHKLCGAVGAIGITLEQALLPNKEICVINDDKNGGIAHAAKQAEIYLQSDLPKRDAILAALGGLIVGYVTAFSEVGKFSPVVAAVRAEISRHLSDCTYSLEDTLRRLPLNYDYVRKLFKKETGVTPHEYLVRERMELARGIIQSGITNQYSGYTVSQIAEACGFAEPLYFSRVFKKYFGVAPSFYK